ncbi:MAG: NAD(P)/FAD-dependent oxidoreductase, partial [Gemmatimonadetes bacterium]|nr:NAD(P)/FAD-dependent oxidoreductase [Gemmatimonadota bacterium]
MAERYDAIVIGGGHNGLTCAAYLAKAGRKVLVLEKRHVLGGAAASEEIYPGFTYSVCSYVVSLLRPQIIRDLDLPKHGLEILPLEASFLPLPDGRSLTRWADWERTRRELETFSPRDAEVYPEFGKLMIHMARFVKPILDMSPPDPGSMDPRGLKELLALGRSFQDLGPELQALKYKMLTMSAADFLDEWFESDALKGVMSVSGIIGTFLGVRSPGTAYVLLHHYMGEIDGAFRSWGLSKGGTGGVSMAIARAAEAFGAEIRTEAGVSELLMKNGEARGVVLENGDEIESKLVVSGCDPRRTLFGFVGEKHLDDETVRSLRNYKMRGSSGKINLALDKAPDFSCRPGVGRHLYGDIAIAPSVAYLERAYDDAKYGKPSREPYMNIVVPSLTDPTVAPPGKHVMSIFIQYAPYHITEGPENWPAKREEWADGVIDVLAGYIPGFKSTILHRQALTPWDLEQEFGLTEGNIFHGELSLEQLFFLRPSPQMARFRTPIRKLWM